MYPSLHRSRIASIERCAVISTACEHEPEQGDHLALQVVVARLNLKFQSNPKYPSSANTTSYPVPHCQAALINSQKIVGGNNEKPQDLYKSIIRGDMNPTPSVLAWKHVTGDRYCGKCSYNHMH